MFKISGKFDHECVEKQTIEGTELREQDGRILRDSTIIDDFVTVLIYQQSRERVTNDLVWPYNSCDDSVLYATFRLELCNCFRNSERILQNERQRVKVSLYIFFIEAQLFYNYML